MPALASFLKSMMGLDDNNNNNNKDSNGNEIFDPDKYEKNNQNVTISNESDNFITDGILDWPEFIVRDLQGKDTTYVWDSYNKQYGRKDALPLGERVVLGDFTGALSRYNGLNGWIRMEKVVMEKRVLMKAKKNVNNGISGGRSHFNKHIQPGMNDPFNHGDDVGVNIVNNDDSDDDDEDDDIDLSDDDDDDNDEPDMESSPTDNDSNSNPLSSLSKKQLREMRETPVTNYVVFCDPTPAFPVGVKMECSASNLYRYDPNTGELKQCETPAFTEQVDVKNLPVQPPELTDMQDHRIKQLVGITTESV